MGRGCVLKMRGRLFSAFGCVGSRRSAVRGLGRRTTPRSALRRRAANAFLFAALAPEAEGQALKRRRRPASELAGIGRSRRRGKPRWEIRDPRVPPERKRIDIGDFLTGL